MLTKISDDFEIDFDSLDLWISEKDELDIYLKSGQLICITKKSVIEAFKKKISLKISGPVQNIEQASKDFSIPKVV